MYDRPAACGILVSIPAMYARQDQHKYTLAVCLLQIEVELLLTIVSQCATAKKIRYKIMCVGWAQKMDCTSLRWWLK